MAEHPSSQKLRIGARILTAVLVAFLIPLIRIHSAASQHLLYVASPGIRNYVEYGGVGILAFDIDKGYKSMHVFGTSANRNYGKKPSGAAHRDLHSNDPFRAFTVRCAELLTLSY